MSFIGHAFFVGQEVQVWEGNDNPMEAEQNVWRVSQEVLKYNREGGNVYVSGQLRVTAEVSNLALNKSVGMRYTCDDWRSYREVEGVWSHHEFGTDRDRFVIHSESMIPPGIRVEYAIYYAVNGLVHWDNNASANYWAQF
ncbi:phosphatase [Pedosphaera parvula]|uniref:Putative phosphatase regulatory subunit n=1 Tax=Pedosphaera parvula (strain Ellin514) TaxID=320771 RepID=B9XM34_PEDPL|nr:phosphatase [Pedosphaera parvula]EEF59162.1 putative phosphatase regulatory subunit [Pedosphaera parvula Ellin514]